MIEQIVSWYAGNNGHPLDDYRFYDIVISSLGKKVKLSAFEKALHDVNNNILVAEIENIYMRYETLYDFLSYYKNHE